jgi:hypothetical protein
MPQYEVLRFKQIRKHHQTPPHTILEFEGDELLYKRMAVLEKCGVKGGVAPEIFIVAVTTSRLK